MIKSAALFVPVAEAAVPVAETVDDPVPDGAEALGSDVVAAGTLLVEAGALKGLEVEDENWVAYEQKIVCCPP